MILYQRSNSILLIILLLINFSGYGIDRDQAILIVKGIVSKGSCSFLLADQVIKFPQPLLAQGIGEVGVTQENKVPFSVTYSCQDYDENNSPDISISIKSDVGTQIVNNKIAPINNLTNAGFSLYDCNNVNSCSLMHFTSGLGLIHLKAGNKSKDKNFKIEIVKLNSSPVKPGNLQATVTLTLAQP